MASPVQVSIASEGIIVIIPGETTHRLIFPDNAHGMTALLKLLRERQFLSDDPKLGQPGAPCQHSIKITEVVRTSPEYITHQRFIDEAAAELKELGL